MVDIEKIMAKAKEKGKILEIDAFPERLDLPDTLIKMAVEKGVRLIIDTDTHQVDQLDFMIFGVYQARRGWAQREKIVNTLPLESFQKLLREVKKS